MNVLKICQCGTVHTEIPERHKVLDNGDDFDGTYFDCKCGSTLFIAKSSKPVQYPEIGEVSCHRCLKIMKAKNIDEWRFCHTKFIRDYDTGLSKSSERLHCVKCADEIGITASDQLHKVLDQIAKDLRK